MASRMRALFILGGLVAMVAAGCPTQTPTGTDTETLTRTNPKRSPSPKSSSGIQTPQDGNGNGSSPGTGSSSSPGTDPSSSPSTGASSSPSPNPSASVNPAADFWVQVNDAAGTAVSGAVVEGYAADATGVATTAGTSTADAKGQATKIEAGGKALNLIARAPSDSTLKGFLAAVDATAKGKVIKLEKVGGIKGTVKVSASGANVENINVYIAGTPFQATTDNAGAFNMAGVPVGTYTVTADSASFGKANKASVAVTAGTETTLGADDLKLSVTAPAITSLSSANAGQGAEVTITGTNFGTGDVPFKVTFGGAEANPVTRTSATTIKATIPAGGQTGDVIVTVNGLASNGKAFTVMSDLLFTNPRTSMFKGTNHTFTVGGIDTKLGGDGQPSFVANPFVTKWEVIDGTAVTVDNNGKVTANTVGTATLKVWSGTVFATNPIEVTDDTVTVSSVAGGTQGTTDGTGTGAKFAGLIGITWNPLNGLTVADQFQDETIDYSAIRAVNLSNNQVTKLYGAASTFADGNAATARFRFPSGLVYDSAGNLFVCDQGSNRIRKITPAGDVTTFVGDGTASSKDGTGTAATTAGPAYICRDAANNLYFTEWGATTDESPAGGAGRIRKVTPAGVVTTLAGGENYAAAGVLTSDDNGFYDGTGATARFMLPSGIAIDAAGQNLYIADFGNNAIRKLALSNNAVTTMAGPPAANQPGLSGPSGFVDAVNPEAVRFNAPAGIAIKDGFLYVADDSNHAIRKVNLTNGATTTLVGTGVAGNTDGNAAAAAFSNPHDLVFKPGANELYVLDNRNFKIRKIVF